MAQKGRVHTQTSGGRSATPDPFLQDAYDTQSGEETPTDVCIIIYTPYSESS